MNQIKLSYDDIMPNIIDKINRALESVGVRLEDDGQPHDGFVVLNLIAVDRE